MVINVRSEKEWDYITKYYGLTWDRENLYSSITSREPCIRIGHVHGFSDDNGYSSRSYYESNYDCVIEYVGWFNQVGLKPNKKLMKHKIS